MVSDEVKNNFAAIEPEQDTESEASPELEEGVRKLSDSKALMSVRWTESVSQLIDCSLHVDPIVRGQLADQFSEARRSDNLNGHLRTFSGPPRTEGLFLSRVVHLIPNLRGFPQ